MNIMQNIAAFTRLFGAAARVANDVDNKRVPSPHDLTLMGIAPHQFKQFGVPDHSLASHNL